LAGIALGTFAVPAAAATPTVHVLPATSSIDFDVHLPLRNTAELTALIANQTSKSSPLYHRFLTPAQFRASYGPLPATVNAAIGALQRRGFAITKTETQLIHVRGTATAVRNAFGVQIGLRQDPSDAVGARHSAVAGTLTVPAELRALGATIAGMTTTVRPRPMFRRALNPANRYATLGGYWFDDLKQAYDYPAYATANGKGVTVATVGESDFSDADAAAYFAHEKLGPGGLAAAPVPQHLLLPGAAPFDPTTGIGDEADLDVQQVGGSAPGATVIGVSVGGPGEAFLEAYSYLDEANIADIVSTSYGECELYYGAAYTYFTGGFDQTAILLAYHDLFLQGNSQGITYIFSSGDDSGTGCYPVGYFGQGRSLTFEPLKQGAGIWVDDPDVTGVGGTNLVTSYTKGSLSSAYASENAIGDTIFSGLDYFGTGNFIINNIWGSGSGYSAIFAKPDFQKLIKVPYATRTIPDVAMHMGGCPYYGPSVLEGCDLTNRDSFDYAIIGGQFAGLIGTSAAAPEFAGLLAVKESVQKSRMGNENYDLYELAAANTAFPYHFFRQGQPAYNGVYKTAGGVPGYSPVIGVGTPIAQNFVLLPFAQAAGLPQTATNP
jgi:subtilase family serine protease